MRICMGGTQKKQKQGRVRGARCAAIRSEDFMRLCQAQCTATRGTPPPSPRKKKNTGPRDKASRRGPDAPSVTKGHAFVRSLHGQVGGVPAHDEGDEVAQHVHGVCGHGALGGGV